MALTTAPSSLTKLMAAKLAALVVALAEGLAMDPTWVLIAALALILMTTLLTLMPSHAIALVAILAVALVAAPKMALATDVALFLAVARVEVL